MCAFKTPETLPPSRQCSCMWSTIISIASTESPCPEVCICSRLCFGSEVVGDVADFTRAHCQRKTNIVGHRFPVLEGAHMQAIANQVGLYICAQLMLVMNDLQKLSGWTCCIEALR